MSQPTEKKAPGKAYRKGIGMVELFEMFPDDSTAEKWIESIRWPDGRTCPDCGSPYTTPCKHRSMPYRCRRYCQILWMSEVDPRVDGAAEESVWGNSGSFQAASLSTSSPSVKVSPCINRVINE